MGASGDGTAQGTPKQKTKGPRERTLPLSPHGHTTRFLYLMLKQVDPKQINWQEVADGTGISKGSAAKLRYSRFKRQIESQIKGDAIQMKKEKEVKEEQGLAEGSGNSVERKTSASKRDRGGNTEDDEEYRKKIKLEYATPIKQEYRRFSSVVSLDNDDSEEDEDNNVNSSLPQSPFVKPEPGIGYGNWTASSLPRSPRIKSEHVTGYATPAKPPQPLRPSNYRSPWAVFESEENQENSPSHRSGCGRATGKGSAQEPFSID